MEKGEKKMKYAYTEGISDPIFKYGKESRQAENAIYSPALIPMDRGNPFIEALPSPMDKSAILSSYYKPFPFKPSIDGDENIQRSEIQLLRDIRFPLPFIPLLEKGFSDALHLSYRARSRTQIEMPHEIIINDETLTQAVSFRSAGGADTGIGVSLLGIGGCGKSAAIETMLSRYPQMILHRWKGTGEFIQIVWLRVVTPVNANLSDLFVSIAAALDEALGNIHPIHERMIKRQKSIGMKADYIAKAIRLFGIGAIILDEIQNLDYSANQTSSFSSLMTIINTTKVALVIVGTDEAFKLLFRKQYILRRAGEIINASNYCLNMKQFDTMMRCIMSVCWFRKAPEITDDILKALYDETSGVIDRMITVWSEIQLDYVTSKEKPVLTPQYIRQISAEKRPFMSVVTKYALEDSMLIEPRDLQALAGSSQDAPAEELSPESLRYMAQSSVTQQVIASIKRPSVASTVFTRVKDNLMENQKEYNDQTVLNAVKHVMELKSNQESDVVELVQKTLRYLSKKRSDKRPKSRIEAYDLDAFSRTQNISQ